MKSLHTKVNIVPLIAKADTLTQTELVALKKTVNAQIEENGINVYVPAVDEEDPESIKEHVQNVESMPFAVVGSSHIIDVGGKSARGRVYPWGVVEGELGLPVTDHQLSFRCASSPRECYLQVATP